MSATVLLPAALPALPSNTKGPALFVGVIGPSLTRSAPVGVVSRAGGESLGGVMSTSRKLGWVGVNGLKLAVRRVASSDLANDDCSSTGCGCWVLCLRDVFRRLIMLETNWLGGA